MKKLYSGFSIVRSPFWGDRTIENPLYIRKVHEKWSIFCFYGMFCIVIVVEKIAFEVGDCWKICVLQRKHECSENSPLNQWKLCIDAKILKIFCFSSTYEKLNFRVNTQLLLIQGRIFGIDKNGMERSFKRQEHSSSRFCVPSIRPVIVYAEFSLRSCFRCDTQIFQKSPTSNTIVSTTITIQNMP